MMSSANSEYEDSDKNVETSPDFSKTFVSTVTETRQERKQNMQHESGSNKNSRTTEKGATQ
jgi:hypothetical protein